ncbi:Rieske Fe-S protein [Litoreibacter ponti]|uniref:Rieske Fe-S protein n=1 Tax=Litoreibacter ponti TaxID=1510457 RepID=A0A2T6BJG7_9RHOB|nr:Rieske (2Fe-2S) protein [Litoreibacter ponti]PTX56200.1 Rieske Fe-S protein [Litoreibacter ponti]
MSETRRSALTLLLGAAAAVGTGAIGYGVMRIFGERGKSVQGAFDLSDLAPGELQRFSVSDRPFAVFHAPGDGLLAYYLTCTRAGCALQMSDDNTSWACPCDEARFALDGEPISGPVPRKLDRVPVRFDGMVLMAPSALGPVEAVT